MTTSCTRYKCIELDDLNEEMISIYMYLILDSVLYWIAFLYFDKVLPAKFGVPQSPIFCLKPLFRWWQNKTATDSDADDDTNGSRQRKAAAAAASTAAALAAGAASRAAESADSLRERQHLQSGNGEAPPVAIMGINHVYDRGLLGRSNGRTALVDLYLTPGNKSLYRINSVNDLFDCNFTYILISAQLHG